MNNLPENISPDLIASYLSQQIDSADALRVEGWINASANNRKDFEQFKVVWEETGKLIPAPVDVDVDSAWGRMSKQMDEAELHGKLRMLNKREESHQGRYWLRIAAVLIPTVLIISISFWMKRGEKQICQTTGQQSQVDTLSDGSIAHINKFSKLSYPEKFSGNTREVEMEGEVYFGIRANKEKPFLIHAENTLIKVVGTSFNVKSKKNSPTIEVLVETGIVVFSEIGKNSDTASIRLLAGEKGIYHKVTHRLEKAKAEDMNDLSWKSQTLTFNRAELSKVLTTLEEHYGVSIELKDKSVAKLHFSVSFHQQSIDSILNIVANTFELKYSKQGKQYTLEKAN